MRASKHLSLIVFCSVLALLAVAIGARWTPAAAGYVDEPAGVIDELSEGGTIAIGESGGDIEFDPGEGKGVVKAGLPDYAKDGLDDLLGSVYGQAYVRTVDENGNPSLATYTVCFDSPGYLYQYFFDSGWVLMDWNTDPGFDVCANGAGEGVFVFTK